MSVDIDSVRQAHRCFPTGVTVVTTMLDGEPKGLAVNAFSSVSLEPPTVLVCVSRASRSYPALMRVEMIGINLLSSCQYGIAAVFASKAADKFAGLEWQPGPCGAPLITGASAHFEVRTQDFALASTHIVIIGEVVSCAHTDQPPLIYLGGTFHLSTGSQPSEMKERVVA